MDGRINKQKIVSKMASILLLEFSDYYLNLFEVGNFNSVKSTHIQHRTKTSLNNLINSKHDKCKLHKKNRSP